MKVLVIAPHADDEVIGCGGTIARLSNEGHDVYLCIATNGCPPLFDNTEAKKEGWPHNNYLEIKKSNYIIGIKETIYLNHPAAMLETVERYKLNESIISLMKTIKPNEVYIPHFGDMQKDHQIIAEAVMVAARPKYTFAPNKIYAYETLSETGWNIPSISNEFIPNSYIDISRYLEKKLQAMSCYRSQLDSFPGARSLDAIEALARYRGATMNIEAAEAFMILREIK